MELCEGDLTDYVDGKLDKIPKDSLDDKIILGQVTLGLAYIHSKEMIHKDIKPANILLWLSHKSNMVLAKIADFGFAKQLKPGRNEFSETLHPGTKSCMAPELLLAKVGGKVPATFESDAYALGITIAYTVLKGRHPYGLDPDFRPILMREGCDPILLGELEWDVTHLILQLTKKEPRERPSVAFLIYHPYFVLTSDNTKAYFEEKMHEYFETCVHYEAFKNPFKMENIEMWIRQQKKEGNDRIRQQLEKVSRPFPYLYDNNTRQKKKSFTFKK